MLKEGNNNALDLGGNIILSKLRVKNKLDYIEGCFGMFFMYIKKLFAHISIYMLALTGKSVTPQNIFFLNFFF